jgi:hypothetical protein
MTTLKEQNELFDKIINGMSKAYQKMIEFKKQKNSVIVVMRDDKIVKLKPY